MCQEMNCDDMTGAMFLVSLEPWIGSRQPSRKRKSPHKKENSAQRAKNSATRATRATARKTTLHRSEEGSTRVSLGPKTRRQILQSAWFSKHTTRPPVHTSVCLKHSHLLNTDRMRKRDGPTAVHMKPFSTSVFNNCDRDVSSSFPSNSNLMTVTSAPNLVEHLCLSESTNSCPTNQDWCRIHAFPLGLT